MLGFAKRLDLRRASAARFAQQQAKRFIGCLAVGRRCRHHVDVTEISLSIQFDGDTPGLAEHSLSLKEFGHSLRLLLSGLQRTASDLLAEAAEGGQARRGRLHNEARRLDVQLRSVEDCCVVLNMRCLLEPQPEQREMFEELDSLPQRAAIRFVEGIKDESQGRVRCAPARKFLASLPSSLNSQTYKVHAGGKLVSEVQVGGVELEEVQESPYLLRFEGELSAVSFPPGRPRITIQAGPRSLSLSATEDQVDHALHLRGQTVSVAAIVLPGKRPRLLWVRNLAEAEDLSFMKAKDYVFRRWDEVLRRLGS